MCSVVCTHAIVQCKPWYHGPYVTLLCRHCASQTGLSILSEEYVMECVAVCTYMLLRTRTYMLPGLTGFLFLGISCVQRSICLMMCVSVAMMYSYLSPSHCRQPEDASKKERQRSDYPYREHSLPNSSVWRSHSDRSCHFQTIKYFKALGLLLCSYNNCSLNMHSWRLPVLCNVLHCYILRVDYTKCFM